MSGIPHPMTHRIHSNSDTCSPSDAAGLAGRFRAELNHAHSHSHLLDKNYIMTNSHFLSLLFYILYMNLLTPQATQITSEFQFLPQTSIHELRVSVEAKLRVCSSVQQKLTPPPPPLPPCGLSLAHSEHRISAAVKHTSFSSSMSPHPPLPPRHAAPPTRNTLSPHSSHQTSRPLM